MTVQKIRKKTGLKNWARNSNFICKAAMATRKRGVIQIRLIVTVQNLSIVVHKHHLRLLLMLAKIDSHVEVKETNLESCVLNFQKKTEILKNNVQHNDRINSGTGAETFTKL